MVSRQEREQMKKAYPNKAWAAKVDKMSDTQAAAVMLRLRQKSKN
jgi:hypothetical protein